MDEGLQWAYCGPRPPRLGPAVLPEQPGPQDQVLVGANTFDYDQELRLLWLHGDVELAQGNRFIAADKLVYDRDSSDLVAKGDIFLASPGARLMAEEGQINLESDRGTLSNVRYRLTGQINARGDAEQAQLVRPGLNRFRNITYTACRPGQRAWSLRAKDLELDQGTGRGVARNATLRLRDIPVFYTPYISFPIDDRRKSGFLVPTLGTSSDHGFELTVPYYWNIAPNMDATISPRVMTKRGLMLGSELRYLSAHQEAVLYGEILPRDSESADEGPRWGARVKHQGRYGQRWKSDLNYNAVSDDQYLEDFGGRLDATSARNIERRGDLSYRADNWWVRTRLQDFQTVDATLPRIRYPYARLPQITFEIDPLELASSGVQLGVRGEYDYFWHDTKVDGQRITMQPYVRWPLRRSYGHLIPSLRLYLAGYDLYGGTAEAGSSPAYAIPSFNLDAGLVFERSIKLFGEESLQTLEPRLFYLYTPFEDQEDIPVFDSSELSFSYYSLFAYNRFSGEDRVGDANQLTVGLTSRTLSKKSGQELLRASVGQIVYWRDRDVQIAGKPETQTTSAIAGSVSAQLFENWIGQATLEYDPNEEQDNARKRTFELRYHDMDDRLLNLAYRFDLGQNAATRYEDTDLTFRMPVNDQLQVVGRWNYSLLHSETIDAFAGIEYGQCCWRLRLLGRHLKNKPGEAGSNSLMVQVELAGLGSLGQSIDKLLRREIYGYAAH